MSTSPTIGSATSPPVTITSRYLAASRRTSAEMAWLASASVALIVSSTNWRLSGFSAL